jgi:hypothetical protein
MVVEVNLSRMYLHRAHEALNRGDLIAAGCLLREAAHRQLVAMCHWYGCTPKKARRRRPMDLARALRDAKACGDGGFEWLREIITAGNTAAHCGRVDRGTLRAAISLLHYFIDADPCGEPRERVAHCLPITEGYDVDDCDDDDDDAADSWKQGGAV